MVCGKMKIPSTPAAFFSTFLAWRLASFPGDLS